MPVSHTFTQFTSLTLLALLGAVLGTMCLLFSICFTFLLFCVFYAATPESLHAMDIMEGRALIVSIGDFSLQFAVWSLAVGMGFRFFYGYSKANRGNTHKVTTALSKTDRDLR